MNGLADTSKVETRWVKNGRTGETEQVSYETCRVVGSGSFGVVVAARVLRDNHLIAIKRVLQDRRYKNRELQIMKSISHPNIVKLEAYFHTHNTVKNETHLSLMLEYIPETAYQALRWYVRANKKMPILETKLYAFQMLRALSYLHAVGVCHRDIKPQNLLVDTKTGVLKLCDFGSAKILSPGEPNVSYICSRYYRAPELVFGATLYTTKIDIWSAACVIGELLLGQPLFPGESSVDQLVEIVKVLGTPTHDQIMTMNPNYVHQRLPRVRPQTLERTLPEETTREGVDLLKRMLEYTPANRISAIDALSHPFFDELRQADAKFLARSNGEHKEMPLPSLFDFSELELSIRPNLNKRIIPEHYHEQLGVDLDTFNPILIKQAGSNGHL
ncbi:CMGC/GSK protein kinase Gsk31 [Schizosaccharomyces japonicus yFS275]|uniref:CMGC/GSK protein kinase Gsk31 n=1 Tax=Schizosaccharomyces japonicus (strain yFS275 / FY16936) TaxID=402676 RepID=B6K4F6_SCHJY|nr:CMGC/GSK protein kinase Gsk31 [Schizosaccharomyces japonicus yFS275]EEB08363.1 CMGC/GSK protein kinase Gsk31 [Schizosaccharomyces japonicus yFS275]